MPRPMLRFEDQKQQQRTGASERLSTQPSRQKTVGRLTPMQIERVLNRRRSAAYMDAMTRLDAGGHMHNRQKVEALIEVIREEMPEIEIDMGPIGIVSKCWLGAPYEVHTLDITGSIIEHFETYRAMPGGLERARSLAKSGYYAFIEVYPHALRAVKEDGTVATLKE